VLLRQAVSPTVASATGADTAQTSRQHRSARASLNRLRGQRIPGPLLFLGVAAGYLALAQFVLWLNDPVHLGAGFWPAAGFSLALLVLVHPRRWGWVLAGVGLAELGGDLAHGYPVDAALWWTAGNCVGPLVGAMLLRRSGNPTGALVPVRQLRRFIVSAVVVGPLVGASIGSIGTVVAIGQVGTWQAWPKYVVGDALGVLVVAPLLLCWKERRIERNLAETTTLVVTLLVATFVAFRTWGGVWDAALPYLVIPLLTWAALRHGFRGAAVAVFTVTQIANWSTATGDGPFANAGAATGHAITLLQMYVVITALSTFVLAALVEDLVDRTEAEARLERQASTDDLTGLPNRASLTSSLSARLASPSSLAGVGVCVCDLDHFKVVNDGLGHHAGDEVLIEVARRMRRCVRPSDLVTRFGGDEFVVLTDGPGHELEQLARRLIAAVAQPMTLSDGTQLTPSVSVGIAHGGISTDSASLLRDADAALYRAKDLGRGRFHRFDDELRLRVVDRLFIQTELRDALANDDFFCVYQPEIVIASGKLFSFEALSRWDHPTRGPISPARFVPVIEAMGAADQLFAHVLEEVLCVQQQWAKRLGFHPAVAVNLSARQLGDTDLPGEVASALTRRGAPADSLWIEVTESALAEEAASGILLTLHDLGVRLAIDDFGTGWSSMARLAAFPWDLLKIDQSFVAELGGSNQYAEQVVSSTIALAHALGIPTTAEGVETHEQLDRLAALGCDIAQGFLFARPAPARDAIAQVTADGGWTGPGVLAARS
jgi:diguanylate cyclase (GGDEF)-like protein